MATPSTPNFAVACHLNYTDGGRLARVVFKNNTFNVTLIPSCAPTGQEPGKRPVFLGISENHSTYLLDPQLGKISTVRECPVDVVPHYAYRDPDSGRLWYSNDGDDETGHDPIACPAGGAPVFVMESGSAVRRLTSACIGRGHHVATFTFPSRAHPTVPKYAFVSNLLDGTICVFGNDPSQADTFLKIVGTIDLIEPEKEKSATPDNPNNAFPHGMVYSPVTGKVYNLNNGYSTIAVMDPITLSITHRITLKKCSNLLLDPTGRYVIAKGADRKTNTDHVLGQLAVVDLATETVVTTLEIPDFYPSTFRFDPDGKKLFVTSAATGKGAQHANLSIDTIRVYDAHRLPALESLTSLQVGRADCGRRPIAFFPSVGTARFIFFPNPTDGTLSIIDATTNIPFQTVRLGEPGAHEVLFSFWDGVVIGT